MSAKHPVIAVTGSSGAGTTTVKNAFEHIFRRAEISPAVIEGDSFHKYDRQAMKQAIEEYAAKGKTWARPSRNIAKPVAVNVVTTYTAKKKQHLMPR